MVDPVTASMVAGAMGGGGGGGLSTGQGSSLDLTSSATSRSGDISSKIDFRPGDLYYKSSTFKTEHYVIIGVVVLLAIYLWRR